MYTENVKYVDTVLSKRYFHEFTINYLRRLKIDPYNPIYENHRHVFTQSLYKYPSLPLFCGLRSFVDVESFNLNVLRLLIRENKFSDPIVLPDEVVSLKKFIEECVNYHQWHFEFNSNCFIYLTARTTEEGCYYNNSLTWHVDGFQGGGVEIHIPEQNFIWSNVHPTEFLLQPFYIEGLNSESHNVHNYFDSHANDNNIFTGVNNGLYVIDPYHVHRVSHQEFNRKRVFLRLTFSPVEIKDYTNTINPFFDGRKYDKRLDVRDYLNDYLVDESVGSGFVRKD